jgi:hypothetical protein
MYGVYGGDGGPRTGPYDLAPATSRWRVLPVGKGCAGVTPGFPGRYPTMPRLALRRAGAAAAVALSCLALAPAASATVGSIQARARSPGLGHLVEPLCGSTDAIKSALSENLQRSAVVEIAISRPGPVHDPVPAEGALFV